MLGTNLNKKPVEIAKIRLSGWIFLLPDFVSHFKDCLLPVGLMYLFCIVREVCSSATLKYFCWKRDLKKQNNSVNFRFVFFFFGNSTADCELVIRKVSKCSGALGTDLPIGVKDDAICRNLVYFSSFWIGTGLWKVYRCTHMSAVSNRVTITQRKNVSSHSYNPKLSYEEAVRDVHIPNPKLLAIFSVK